VVTAQHVFRFFFFFYSKTKKEYSSKKTKSRSGVKNGCFFFPFTSFHILKRFLAEIGSYKSIFRKKFIMELKLA
jgi:hypothetical protein